MRRMKRLLCLLTALLFVCLCQPALAAKPTATPNPDAIVEPTLNPDANPYDPEHPEDLEEEQLYGLSAILVERDKGFVIFEKDADARRYPASTTKILTVWLGITMVDDLDMMVTVSESAVNIPDDATTMNLHAGEEVCFRDVLYGTMLLSANDGANVIAEVVSGSQANFVNLMNETAVLLGCTDTHFMNAHGYPDDNHYTTARDLALIARTAMSSDVFRQIVGTYTYTLPKTNMSRSRTISNTNELMRMPEGDSTNKYYYPYANGMKTGSAKSSAYCFVGSAEKDGVALISVVLYTGKRARWADTIKLMDYGFSQYTSVTPIDLYKRNPITLETSGYALDDPDMGRLKLSCQPVDAAVASKTKIIATYSQVEAMALNLHDTVLIQYDRDFAAPIEAGEVMGTMSYFTEKGEVVRYNLIAERSIARRANAPKTIDEIRAEVMADPSIMPPITIEIILMALAPFAFVMLIVLLVRALRRRRRTHVSQMPKIGRRFLK